MESMVTQNATAPQEKKEKKGSRGGPRRQNDYSAWLWVGPAVLFVAIFLFYPALNTIWFSFFNMDSSSFVGLQNFVTIFTSANLLDVLKNNILWLIVATAGTVLFGLLIAVLVDRVRIERTIKAVIFIPMAISFVGASVIWGFVYQFAPAGQPQIGLLNAIITSVGIPPQAWLINSPLNDFALMVIYIWIWTGFCMVILSAALKSIPTEIMEAARVDGANEIAIFFRIILPMISPTIAVVATTMIINVLKIFDIIYATTGGAFHTDVVAHQYYVQYFTDSNFGLASALAVLLLIAVIPIMYVNIQRFRVQEAQR